MFGLHGRTVHRTFRPSKQKMSGSISGPTFKSENTIPDPWRDIDLLSACMNMQCVLIWRKQNLTVTKGQ
jgi:hypothetical protein